MALRRRRGEDAAGVLERRPDEKLDGDTRGAGDESSELARAVLGRLEADRAWAEERFREVVERLDGIEARLKHQAGATEEGAETSARPRTKEGLSRQQVLAIRATKQRARRAAKLKAQREDSAASDEDSA